MKIERRAFEFRAEDDGSTITGTVIPYQEFAQIGSFRERFLPGSISFADVIANRQHDRSKPLARTGGGGLELTDGPDALRARIELPDTVDGRDVRELIRLKVLRGLSAEFRVKRDIWERENRTIQEAVLAGLAIVDKGAYEGATLQEKREAIEFLTAACRQSQTGKHLPAWPYL